jgi:hypothetical protein
MSHVVNGVHQLPIDIMNVIASYTLFHRLYILQPDNGQGHIISSITMESTEWRHSSPMPQGLHRQNLDDGDKEYDTEAMSMNDAQPPSRFNIGGGCVVNDGYVMIVSSVPRFVPQAFLSIYTIATNQWSLRRVMNWIVIKMLHVHRLTDICQLLVVKHQRFIHMII